MSLRVGCIQTGMRLSESNATEYKAIVEKLYQNRMRSSTAQKPESQISNFYFLISAFSERIRHCSFSRLFLANSIEGSSPRAIK
jgi:hypothetical protein